MGDGSKNNLLYHQHQDKKKIFFLFVCLFVFFLADVVLFRANKLINGDASLQQHAFKELVN